MKADCLRFFVNDAVFVVFGKKEADNKENKKEESRQSKKCRYQNIFPFS